MELEHCFPVWNKLTAAQQEALHRSTREKQVKKGALLHAGGQDCTGLLIVRQGQLRAYILSEEGREVTIYRLVEGDVCLFSASCMMRSIQFDVTVEAERDTVTSDRLKRLALEKEAAKLKRELMRGRESQFFDAMRLDLELEEQIKVFTEKEKLTTNITREFMVRLEG